MAPKIKIVADDKIPFLRGVLEPFAKVEYYPGKEITKEKVLDADCLIVRTRTKCNAELLEGTNIKLITTATIGFDHIDLDYCKLKSIKWVNVPGCNSVSVMQYISAALLKIASDENITLSDKTIGIVGVGNVGSKIQRFAEAMDMRILLNDPPRERNEGNEKFCSIEKIINESDIMTFHVPLNRTGIDKTYHLADEFFFEKLRMKPVIMNTSRGEVIKTSAIKTAIKNGIISKTIIDVWENEPGIDLELLDLVSIATPHIAGYSADGKANGTAVCVNEINKFFKLGIDSNWFPPNVPADKNGHKFVIDCTDKTNKDIIAEAVGNTYSISDDDKRLRNSTETFEKQRGDYPIRREFNNYHIVLKNCKTGIADTLKQLSFKVEI